MDCSLPGFSVHGIFQARILEWVVISSSRGLSQPRDPTCISCIGRHILYHWATWEAHEVSSYHFFPHLSVEDIKAQGSSITCPESCSLLCGWRVSIDPLLLLLLPSPAPTRRNQKEIEVRGPGVEFLHKVHREAIIHIYFNIRKGVLQSSQTIKCSGLKLTHVTFAHKRLARTNHLSPPRFEAAKKCNPTLCLERGDRKSLVSITNSYQNYIL